MAQNCCTEHCFQELSKIDQSSHTVDHYLSIVDDVVILVPGVNVTKPFFE